MRPDQFIPLLVILAVVAVLGLAYFRRSGEARGRGWLIGAMVLVAIVGALVMLYPLFGLQPDR